MLELDSRCITLVKLDDELDMCTWLYKPGTWPKMGWPDVFVVGDTVYVLEPKTLVVIDAVSGAIRTLEMHVATGQPERDDASLSFDGSLLQLGHRFFDTTTGDEVLKSKPCSSSSSDADRDDRGPSPGLYGGYESW